MGASSHIAVSRLWLAGFALLATSGCSVMKVANLDETGYYPGALGKATVVLNKPLDLDSRRDVIVVADSDYERGQVRNIGFFGEVISIPDLELKIIQAGITDKVPSVRDRIGMSKAAKHWKPFLWLRYHSRTDDNGKRYAQFILTDPATTEEYFITETYLDYAWSGVNDQYNWYPMYNTFIDYIKANSKNYTPPPAPAKPKGTTTKKRKNAL
jgi:hypothetical protein